MMKLSTRASGRFAALFFFAAYITPVVRADASVTVSCMDLDVHPGTTEKDCTRLCAPGDFLHTDYASLSDDGSIVLRNVHCNCTSQDKEQFRCVDQLAVFNRTGMSHEDDCSEYNLTTPTDCRAFCFDLDPQNYGFENGPSGLQCNCGPEVPICGYSSGSVCLGFSWAATLMGFVVSAWMIFT